MHSTSTLNDLKIKGQPPNIRLHKLQGDRKNQWSVTIKLPWRITFEFVNGRRSISPQFVIELQRVLGTTAEMWVRMQAEFDLWQARQKVA